jgi:hypothetical protein
MREIDRRTDMTTLETFDLTWVRAPGEGALREAGAAPIGVHTESERRAIGVSLRRLLQRMAPPARYRLTAVSAGSWNFQDWESLMASVSYLREMGYDLSTLRVESPAPRTAPAPSLAEPAGSPNPARPQVIKPAFAPISQIRRRYGVLGRAA